MNKTIEDIVKYVKDREKELVGLHKEMVEMKSPLQDGIWARLMELNHLHYFMEIGESPVIELPSFNVVCSQG